MSAPGRVLEEVGSPGDWVAPSLARCAGGGTEGFLGARTVGVCTAVTVERGLPRAWARHCPYLDPGCSGDSRTVSKSLSLICKVAIRTVSPS